MQIHGLRLQHRGQDVALDLLDHDDEHQHQDRGGHAVGDQGDDDGDEAGGERTDDRDEAGEERDHGQHQRQRHVQEPQAQADENGVDQGHQRLRADESAEGVPGAGHDLGEVPAQAAARDGAQPGQEVATVLDEEEGQHEHHHEGDGDAADDADALENGVGDVAGTFLHPVGGLVEQVEQLLVLDVERRALEHRLQFDDAAGELFLQVRQLGADGRGDQRDDAADDADRAEQGNQRGQGGRPLVADEKRGGRAEDRGDDERQQHRQQSRPHLSQGGERHEQGGADDEEAQAPAGEPPGAFADDVGAVDGLAPRLLQEFVEFRAVFLQRGSRRRPLVGVFGHGQRLVGAHGFGTHDLVDHVAVVADGKSAAGFVVFAHIAIMGQFPRRWRNQPGGSFRR